MNNLLEVSRLGKSYAGFELSNVSFSIPGGYVMGLIGPNGAGKTTTIKAILGMIRPDRGDIRLLGRDASSDNLDLRAGLGVVMDLPFFVEDWRVRSVEKALAPFYESWDSRRYAAYLKRFGIDGAKKVKELSRGTKVKLMLAAALSHNAKLLILDEPTSGLDPVARDEFMDLLQEYVSDETKSVLFSTHITADLEKIADYITFIIGGRVVYTGEKDALLEKYLRIQGGKGDLTPRLRQSLIGLREHSAGFEAMAQADKLASLPKGVEISKITLDDIIIFMNRGNAAHE